MAKSTYLANFANQRHDVGGRPDFFAGARAWLRQGLAVNRNLVDWVSAVIRQHSIEGGKGPEAQQGSRSGAVGGSTNKHPKREARGRWHKKVWRATTSYRITLSLTHPLWGLKIRSVLIWAVEPKQCALTRDADEDREQPSSRHTLTALSSHCDSPVIWIITQSKIVRPCWVISRVIVWL